MLVYQHEWAVPPPPRNEDVAAGSTRSCEEDGARPVMASTTPPAGFTVGGVGYPETQPYSLRLGDVIYVRRGGYVYAVTFKEGVTATSPP